MNKTQKAILFIAKIAKSNFIHCKKQFIANIAKTFCNE